MDINACGATHKGNVRNHNEDNIYLDGLFRKDLSKNNVIIRSIEKNEPHSFAVFDGLGGEACGEQASLIAAIGLKTMADRRLITDVDTFVSAAHKAILQEAMQKDARNMGTTMALANIFDDLADIYYIGDSRVYLFRDGRLEQLSKDHSVVQSMIDYGFMDESERRNNKHSGELTQYLGMPSDDDVEPGADRRTIRLIQGDIILLCSDGLTGELDDDEIEKTIFHNKDKGAEYITLKLIKEAVDRQGLDNISVIVVCIG